MYSSKSGLLVSFTKSFRKSAFFVLLSLNSLSFFASFIEGVSFIILAYVWYCQSFCSVKSCGWYSLAISSSGVCSYIFFSLI